MDMRVVVGIAVVAVVFVLFALHSFFAGTVAPVGAATVSFMGVPLSLHAVEGRDAPCVGAPEGYTRVFFEDQSGVDPDMEVSLTVGYAREGDHLREAMDWIRKRTVACGFTKTSEQSVAVPGARGASLQYSKGDDVDLTIDAGVVTGSDGREYTLIRVGYDKYVPYDDEASADTTESSPQASEAPEEVALPQSLLGVDDEIRPVLGSVFGGAYPTEYATLGTSHTVAYHVARQTTPDDAVAVAGALEGAGWDVVETRNDGTIVEIGATRENVVLEVSFDLGTERVDVLWVQR